MPFPWKKVKSTRISQLVNDHLHKSQKRRDGSSLVVATGFPTSLIDLVIKNREKLKRKSKRKRQNPPASDDANDPSISGSPLSSDPHFPAAPPPSVAASPTPAHAPLRSPSTLQNLSVLPSPSSCESEIPVGYERGANVYRVLFGVLKMILVVVLAMGTHRLTVGITLSAFLLLFLEYVGKHASRFSTPFPDARGVLSPIVRSVSRLFRFKEVRSDEKKRGVPMNPGPSSQKSFGYPDQEIQAVEPKGSVDEIQPVNEIIEEESCLGYKEIELIETEELICDVAEYKRKSRRARIKSKMKKLIPKKFKSSRKENGLERTQTVEETSVVSNEEQVHQCKIEGESVIAREEDGAIEVSTHARLAEEADTKKEEKVRGLEAGLNWRRFVVLCLIVLIGLIGGRAFALVLTFAWLLVLKLGEMLQRYMNKVPIIKSHDDKSC